MQDLNINLQEEAPDTLVATTQALPAAVTVVVAADLPVFVPLEGPSVVLAQGEIPPGLPMGNAGSSTSIISSCVNNSSTDYISMQDMYILASQHAYSILDGSHLMSGEGIELWGKHFYPSPTQVASSFVSEVPVSWFNFILHLLLTPDKFN